MTGPCTGTRAAGWSKGWVGTTGPEGAGGGATTARSGGRSDSTGPEGGEGGASGRPATGAPTAAPLAAAPAAGAPSRSEIALALAIGAGGTETRGSTPVGSSGRGAVLRSAGLATPDPLDASGAPDPGSGASVPDGSGSGPDGVGATDSPVHSRNPSQRAQKVLPSGFV